MSNLAVFDAVLCEVQGNFRISAPDRSSKTTEFAAAFRRGDPKLGQNLRPDGFIQGNNVVRAHRRRALANRNDSGAQEKGSADYSNSIRSIIFG